ncbi:hypothetical protein HCU40_20495 (plasmid) [Pseudanabaena biceps]|nr:hypothetical protein [Pseudanabaena biceps]
MSELRISKEKLLATSNKWSNLPDKFSTKDEVNSLMELVRALEDSIKVMRQMRYSFKDISAKFLEEFQVDISPQTISGYLAAIKKERKQSLFRSSRDARQASRASSAKKAKKEGAVPVDLSVDGQVQPLVSLEDSAVTLSIEKQSVDDAITEASINPKSSKNKQSPSSTSVVPKLNHIEVVDANADDDEIEKLKQVEMLKHFNNY